MRKKYEKPQMNADEHRFVERVFVFIIDKFNSITKDNSGNARLFPPARALACLLVAQVLAGAAAGEVSREGLGLRLTIGPESPQIFIKLQR
jgi:hypothetical protein